MDKDILAVIVIVGIAGIIGLTIVLQPSNDRPPKATENITFFEDEISSGPLHILKPEYKLGETVYFHVRDLPENDKGNIVFITPRNIVFKTFPVDGTIKSDFNNYFKPDTFSLLDICTQEELIGTWTALFENLPYKPLQFEVTEEKLRGADVDITTVC